MPSSASWTARSRSAERPLGRALDLGCGTGEYTRQLEQRGWHAVGVDNIRLAVDIAERRGGDESRYVIGDVTHLKGCGVGTSFSFFLDVGCFNSLQEEQRLRPGRGRHPLANPDATMLLLCTAPHPTLLHPPGADGHAVEAALPGWRVVTADPADSAGLPHWLRRNSPTWYRLALN